MQQHKEDMEPEKKQEQKQEQEKEKEQEQQKEQEQEQQNIVNNVILAANHYNRWGSKLAEFHRYPFQP